MMEENQLADLISQFNIDGWGKVTADEIVIKPLGDGYINSTHKIDRVDNNNDDTSSKRQPSSLVLKLYGGNKFADHLEEALTINPPSTHLLISYELSKRRWGPHLYGVIENGRIEEYIDCHTLDPNEAFTDEISGDSARALARFHSIDLPLPRNQVSFLEPAKISFEKEIPLFTKWMETADATEECLEAFKFLLKFPYEQEYNWVSSVIGKIQHRQVLCARDPNYLNRLVKKNKPLDPRETRCMIIDFDFSCYYDRGFDIGGHFAFRVLDGACKTNKLTGLPYPSKEEREYFLTRYLEETSLLIHDFDPKSLDTVDHLRLEADAYAPFYLLWVIFVSGGFYKMYHVEPFMYTMIHYTINLYFTLKRDFCNTYKHLFKD